MYPTSSDSYLFMRVSYFRLADRALRMSRQGTYTFDPGAAWVSEEVENKSSSVSVVCTFSKCHGTWMAPCGARCNKSSGIMHVPLQSEMFQLERLV